MRSIAWIAITYALERDSQLETGTSSSDKTLSVEAVDQGTLPEMTPCAISLACDWEREQREVELATWKADDKGGLLP